MITLPDGTTVKMHFITFASKHKRFREAAENLASYAKSFDMFESITVHTEDTIPEFIEIHKEFLEKNPRGFGYWLWKPYIIHKTLCSIPEGEMVFYMDSCCGLQVNAKKRLIDYIDMAHKNKDGNLFFGPMNPIYHWCKMDTILSLDAKDVMFQKEFIPGVLMTTNTEKNRSFFKLFYDTCCNYHLVDDSPSVSSNHSEFREHRHDQSIFSILARKYLPDSLDKELGKELLWYWTDEYPISIRSNNYIANK